MPSSTCSRSTSTSVRIPREGARNSPSAIDWSAWTVSVTVPTSNTVLADSDWVRVAWMFSLIPTPAPFAWLYEKLISYVLSSVSVTLGFIVTLPVISMPSKETASSSLNSSVMLSPGERSAVSSAL